MISAILSMSAGFTIAFLIMGVCIGVGFAIALQAAFDDMASKKQ